MAWYLCQAQKIMLYNATKQVGLEISQVTAFKEQIPVRCKIVLDNTILEQIITFTYLECKILYKRKRT